MPDWENECKKRGITPWPIHRHAPNMTMNKKLSIGVCPVGAIIRREQNPYQAYTSEEISKEVIESYNEGASFVHLHCRDERGFPTARVDVFKKTEDLIFDKCPDIIAAPSTAIGLYPEKGLYSIEATMPFVDGLLAFGRRYIESTVFTPMTFPSYNYPYHSIGGRESDSIQTIGYEEQVGVKPELMIHNFDCVENVLNFLIEPGVLKEPYYLTMGPGMHHTLSLSPDPWGYLYLMNLYQYIRSRIPGHIVVGASVGDYGRNWLPVAVFAIMLGVDTLRVGMEDTVWMYPHKDEKIKKCADVVRKITVIAKELGRDIASPMDTRKLLGLTTLPERLVPSKNYHGRQTVS